MAHKRQLGTESVVLISRTIRKSLETLEGIQKAAGAVALLVLTQTLDPEYAEMALNELSKTINGIERYQDNRLC